MSGPIKDIGSVILHSASQFSVGLLSGSLIEALMPIPVDVISTPTEALLSVIEASLQITASGLVASVVFSQLQESETPDYTMGIGFTSSLLFSQPSLQQRLKSLSVYLRDALGKAKSSSSDSDGSKGATDVQSAAGRTFGHNAARLAGSMST